VQTLTLIQAKKNSLVCTFLVGSLGAGR